MKRNTIVAIVLLTIGALSARAQDTTRTFGSQGDPTFRQPSKQIQEMNLRDMVEIKSSELPEGVQKTLNADEYKAQSKKFFKHKEKDEYGVEVRDGEVTRFFMFDKSGKLITNRQE